MTGRSAGRQDKVTVGISGGEYGVRGYLTSYDINTGKQVWRAYSVGADQDMLFDPDKTIDAATQQPVGKDSSLKTWHERRVEARAAAPRGDGSPTIPSSTCFTTGPVTPARGIPTSGPATTSGR